MKSSDCWFGALNAVARRAAYFNIFRKTCRRRRGALLGPNEVLFAAAREEEGALLVELGFFIAGGGPYSEATLACSSVRLEWETFSGLAWFEERYTPDAQ